MTNDTVQDQNLDPVSFVIVDIYDAGNTVFLHRVITDALGQATVNLDDATYTVRQARAFYTPSNVAETLIVTADASVTYSGTVFTVADAPSPLQCRISGFLRDGENPAGAGIQLVFKAVTPQNDVGLVQYIDIGATAVTDATGFFTIDLDRGIRVAVTSPECGLRNVVKLVPQLGTQNFSTW